MKAQGCKADAIVYNAIIDALWETGVVWVQRRALKLFRCDGRAHGVVGCLGERSPHSPARLTCTPSSSCKGFHPALTLHAHQPCSPFHPPPRVAVEEGHFHQGKLVPGLARAEVNLHAMTAGVAMLSLYAWLVSLKQLLSQHGPGGLLCRA